MTSLCLLLKSSLGELVPSWASRTPSAALWDQIWWLPHMAPLKTSAEECTMHQECTRNAPAHWCSDVLVLRCGEQMHFLQKKMQVLLCCAQRICEQISTAWLHKWKQAPSLAAKIIDTALTSNKNWEYRRSSEIIWVSGTPTFCCWACVMCNRGSQRLISAHSRLPGLPVTLAVPTCKALKEFTILFNCLFMKI